MYDWNGSIRSLNVGLPDDIARLKATGYYQEAIARIDSVTPLIMIEYFN